MNQDPLDIVPKILRMPHVCGDEPLTGITNEQAKSVCPTYVGMNRNHGTGRGRGSRMPHVCGDEPAWKNFRRYIPSYAPRMWG